MAQYGPADTHACRDNPFAHCRDGPGGLAEIDAPIGTFLAYATAPAR
jgi:hypothetical protein